MVTSGIVRVGMPESFLGAHLPDLLAAFTSGFPNVQLAAREPGDLPSGRRRIHPGRESGGFKSCLLELFAKTNAYRRQAAMFRTLRHIFNDGSADVRGKAIGIYTFLIAANVGAFGHAVAEASSLVSAPQRGQGLACCGRYSNCRCR